ncbi:cysteine desulfurase family protein [Pseudovibrio sp. Tun.PSC04-5.I4]|uniref:cysteine desulfurase family protein n=1 Tax=Pseudovibrio sp. Tun.PSC04-5.I4 TaxID=1798213 RepID=UPI0008831F7E|nr:cysteine desulfurase family protein [Pseudovibrio sp. Tun.PSC04-5.I4]SDQ98440.1 cysteine desulfurase [Pseudovibrio sp. Tun.PSC04-5.I4]
MTANRELTYLDYNASAPLREESLLALQEAYKAAGNASSIHSSGRRARAIIEDARHKLSDLVDGNPANVIFTSGASEANVTALSPTWLKNGEPFILTQLFVSAIEHPSVIAGGRFATQNTHVIPVDDKGRVIVAELKRLLEQLGEDETVLVSVMAANSETGVLQPLQEVGVLVEDLGHVFHVDAVQMAGKAPVSIEMIGCNSLSISSHKIGGPQGVGALILGKGDFRPVPLLTGGGQESWRRAGTENTAGIAGFAVAAAQSTNSEERARISGLRDYMEERLKVLTPEAVIFGQDVLRLGNTTCFAVEGISAETALINFDLSDVAVSSGSACSSGKVGASHVLLAMGISETLARGAIRVSLGWATTKIDIERFLIAWTKIFKRMKPTQKG